MQKLSNPTIDEIEGRLGVSLPGLYRKLLIEAGFGIYGQKSDCKFNTTKEIYHPESVRDLYEEVFDDPRLLFALYFPFGCDNRKQELWIIDAASERVASIWHETHPDDWPEEHWMSYEDWVRDHLEEGGAEPFSAANAG